MTQLMRQRRWFALDAHEGDGGEGGQPGDGTGTPGEGQPAGDSDEPKTFTQEEVNRIVRQRAERMLKQQLGDDVTLDQLGDIKQRSDRYAEIEAEQQTELERIQQESAAEKQAREQAEARAQRVAVRAAVLERAVDKKITDPKLAAKLAADETIEFDDDGEPTNIDEVLDTLVNQYPALTVDPAAVNGAGSGSGDGGVQPNDPSPTNWREADQDKFASELSKYGLAPRT